MIRYHRNVRVVLGFLQQHRFVKFLCFRVHPKLTHTLLGVPVGRLDHLVPPRTRLFDLTFDPRPGKPVGNVQYFSRQFEQS